MEPGSQKRLECRYAQRQCNKVPVDGYQLCKNHILEDKESPFLQCGYVSAKTGRRCVQATLNPCKSEGSLCLQHTTRINRARRAAAKKRKSCLSLTCQSVLRELGDYVEEGSAPSVLADTGQSLLAELASSDNSDIEERSYPSDGMLWQPDSDSESIDSENEDIFKYAEVFTAEEVTRIARDKLIRLQSLYIEQFKWLHNVLKERRREYLQATDGVEDFHCTAKVGDSLRDEETHKQYRAMKKYHHRYGREALLYMKSQERRKAAGSGSSTDIGHHNRFRNAFKHGTKYCSARSAKCHEKSLPFTKFCLRHIENDSKQALFKRCGFKAVDDGLRCERVVVGVDSDSRCHYHASLERKLSDPTGSNCYEEKTAPAGLVNETDEQNCDEHSGLLADICTTENSAETSAVQDEPEL
ncbi:KAT8 regulatory NSL complex subunit 2-like [Watersipora subatra]|uniref:KAT8 regulatory NSL complex subunit 2-like n=1 Tax=Watersipora subatra TaxID=2589382 RepID=UPI00355C57FF